MLKMTATDKKFSVGKLLEYWHSSPLGQLAEYYPIHLGNVPGNKVIIVATRPPKTPLSGGMAPAIKQACEGYDYKYWYAYGEVTQEDSAFKRMVEGAFNGYYKKTVPITAYDVEGFRVRQIDASPEKWDAQYNRYCNQIVWPICHNLPEYAKKDLLIDDFSGNLGANDSIARRIVEDLNGDTKTPIWIHDYHHLPLASKLRSYGIENPIVYFHHIPLPTLETLNERTEREREHFKQMIGSLRACDAVLFQTEEIVKRFYQIVDKEVPESIPAYKGHFLPSRRGYTYIGHAPISINTAKEMAIANGPQLKTKNAKELDNKLVAENIFINFERCDYSKGILQRVKAFEELMERRPDLHGKVQLVLGAEPTRSDIEEYQKYAKDVKDAVKRINDRKVLWANDHEPIIFINKNVDHDDVIRLMRNRKKGQRRIGLVTPHEDGMNLTSKEFAVAQDPENAGVLAISSGAGTAAELGLADKGALVYQKIRNGNVDRLVDVMEQSIDMPQEEANKRAVAMQDHLKEYNIQRWSKHTRDIFINIQNSTFFPKNDNDPSPQLTFRAA